MKKVALCALSICLLACNDSQVSNKNNEEIILEHIMSRKSVRQYTERPVQIETIEEIIKVGMSAPTGKDRRPWEFIIVDDREKLDKLSEGLPHAKMLKKASVAIVVAGNEETSHYWYLDCSAAAQNILLAIEAKGLGGVWTCAYPFEDRVKHVQQELGMPAMVKPLCIIPVGYPMGIHKAKDKFNKAKIHHGKW